MTGIEALAATVTSFGSVFLKGFQQKNVIAGRIGAAAVTSYLIAFFDVAVITLIVRGGWIVALATGTGAALGMVTAIRLHDKLFATTKE